MKSHVFVAGIRMLVKLSNENKTKNAKPQVCLLLYALEREVVRPSAAHLSVVVVVVVVEEHPREAEALEVVAPAAFNSKIGTYMCISWASYGKSNSFLWSSSHSQKRDAKRMPQH